MPAAPRALTAAQAIQLQEAFGLLKAGKTGEALAIGQRLVSESAQAPDAQQLLAICLDASSDSAAAERVFQAALDLAPDHPMIRGNYSTLLCKLGLAALKNGHTQKALATLRRAVELQPRSARAWHALGNVHRSSHDLESAEADFRKAIELDPAYASAWVNRGMVLRLLGRPDEAITCYEQAEKAGYTGPELADALAGALLDEGRLGEAMQQVRRVTREHPDFIPGYVTLANLLWEHGPALAQAESPVAAFLAAVESQPYNHALRMEFACFLLTARQAEDALAQIKILQAQDYHPVLASLEANALEILGRTEQAGALYAQIHRAQGSKDPAFLNAYTRHLLRAGEWDAAAARATEATLIDPTNQEAWAYLGTAWRLTGDSREFWLFDYERLITMAEIEPPAGFADLPEFLQVLKITLEPLHQAKREPVQQSLRGGSQTPGRLFGRRDPVIEATRATLAQSIERHLAALPSDPNHPYLMRKARSVRFGGSWSVRLWSSGNHVNHIHPEGWMSSAFYVDLPPSVRSQGADRYAGCIQFGQPPQELGLNLPPRLQLRPEPGKLALFPSYMWHGTVPFEDDAARLTVAFDMIPSQDSP